MPTPRIPGPPVPEHLTPLTRVVWPQPRRQGRSAPSPRLAPRLVIRLYGAADASRRSRMLQAMLRPLGVLGLAAVAAGAFLPLLGRQGPDWQALSPERLSAYSKEQLLELARFVQEVEPEALLQVAGLLADAPWALPAFSLAALLLLRRTLAPALRASLPAALPAPPGR